MAKTTTTNVTINSTAQEENTMTITNYAQEIANCIEDATVSTVEKANGVIMTAVTVHTNADGVRANFYIEQYFKDGMSVDEAVKEVENIMHEKTFAPDFDLSMINDFDRAKRYLRARLYNKRTTAPISRPASEYGFDDLVIVPYLNLSDSASTKVIPSILKTWNVTAEEVLRIAEENAREDASMMSMADILGLPDFMCPPMTVVSNSNKMFGAYAVIAKMDDIRKMYPNGFTVLPSSVHEVIVIEKNEENEMSALVQSVNTEQVDLTEQLSDHAYTFA